MPAHATARGYIGMIPPVLPSFADPRAAAVSQFLSEIGIAVSPRELTAETFLPGIEVEAGGLLVDESHLAYPGDLLHEAGHIALAPAVARPTLSASVDLPGVDMTELEHGAVAWSYAAALAIGIDPAEVFHAGGYRGRSDSILATFSAGVYPGVRLLEAAGMTASPRRAETLGVPPYPHMLRWLRD
jgi:hypothetical protein